ncbi:MAG: MarR family transcriptional regulator [Microbacteriaceae bacterium]
MTRETTEELIARFVRERRAITGLLATQRLQPVLGLELTVQQLKIVLLVATGAASTGKELADILRITHATVSAGVDRLVALGYLARDEASADRRVKHLTATPLSTRLHDQFLDGRDGSEELLSSLDPADLAALVRGMTALRRAVEQRTAQRDE